MLACVRVFACVCVCIRVCVHAFMRVCVQCSPWAKRSCCTEATAQGIGFDRAWLNFDWHHCGSLSPECTQHFIKDLCFYECSPNVGPYLQPVSMYIMVCLLPELSAVACSSIQSEWLVNYYYEPGSCAAISCGVLS